MIKFLLVSTEWLNNFSYFLNTWTRKKIFFELGSLELGILYQIKDLFNPHKTFALTITQIFNSKKFQDEVKKLSKLFCLWTFYENKFQAGETANSNRPEIPLGANLDKGKILEQIEPKDFNEWLANMRYGV